MIIHLIAGLIKKTQCNFIDCTYKNESVGEDINVKVDLSGYATKTDIKNISHVNTSSFALNSNLASL